MRLSPRALARSRAIAISLAAGSKSAARRFSRVFNRPADVLEGVRKSTAGTAASTIIDSATGNELKVAYAKAAAQKDVIGKGLQRVAGKVGTGIGRFHRKIERSTLKTLKNSPLLSTGVRVTGHVGTLTGRVAGRLVGTAIELAQGTPKVSGARRLGAVLSENFGEIAPRQIARDIRRSKDIFTKKITRPVIESLTGKVEYATANPGLGSVGKRKYGLFQRLRGTISPDTKAQRGLLTKQIRKQLSERKGFRADFIAQMKSTKDSLAQQGLVKGTKEYQDAYLAAKRVARAAHSEKLTKAREIYGIKLERNKETREVVKQKAGTLIKKFQERYKGADVDLGSTALVGGTTLYVGNQFMKDAIGKIKQTQFMRERRKEDDRIRAMLEARIAVENPELDEYDRSNLVNARVRQYRYTQAIASSNLATRDLLLGNISTEHDSPQTAPKESKLKTIKTKPRALKKVLIKKK